MGAKNVPTKSGLRSTLSFVIIFSSSRFVGWVSYLSVFLRSPGAKKGVPAKELRRLSQSESQVPGE